MANVRFVEMSNHTDVSSLELRQRAEASSRTRISKWFLVFAEQTEIAYMCLDINPDDTFLVLYELFIQSDKRRTGFGRSILAELEIYAKSQGYGAIALRPRPIDNDMSEADLIKWYKSASYSEHEDDSDLLVKYF